MSKKNISDLLVIMEKLRSPEGCPWDKEQDHKSILSCLIEETYEFIDAVDNEDLENMQEELGDLLLQVVFHAQMAKEKGHFDFDDIADTISEKLIRRHPHVFGEVQLEGSDAVVQQWEEIKKQEKKDAPKSALSGVPNNLPALLKAQKIQKKAAQVGFDWPDTQGPAEKIREELAEFEIECNAGDTDKMEAEFGDLLFSVVNLGRKLKIDPEKALGRTNQKFVKRFHEIEKQIAADGKEAKGLDLAALDQYWEKAKAITG
jgi:tetrapyrrole methylase family protein / MazG family protein